MENVRRTEVLIVGAGPAGTVCGSLMKKSGVDCLLVDHANFPRDKVCGGGLTIKAWRLLDMLLPGIEYDYRPIDRMCAQFEDDDVCEFKMEHPIRMTRREDFDYSLLQYYQKAGGELIKGSFAHFEQKDDKRILVTLKSGFQIDCHYLVAADGANSLIRRQVCGPVDMKHHFLFLEMYDNRMTSDDVFVHFSKKYKPGCLYKFSSNKRDIWGFISQDDCRDGEWYFELFRNILRDFGVPVGRVRGAYIPMNTVLSPVGNVILIGDAGGFPNKLTGEGLYDAFKTAYNAKRTIVEGIPFSETNAEVFKKMKNQEKVFAFFFSKFGFYLIRRLMRYPRLCKWVFDIKMRREYWVE